MTAPFISVTVAILYFGWLWHDHSAVERCSASLESQPTKETNRTRELLLARPAAVQTPRPKSLKQNNRPTVLQEEIAQ